MASTITAVATLAGDPDAIRAAGRNWRTAAMACAAAAAQVGGVTVIDRFLGDESTTWEQRLGPETSGLLSTLATARDIVGGALVSYAEVLKDCQQELRTLAIHRAEAAAALDRWRDTPTATPDTVDSATQTVHDLDARGAAVLARHAAGVRACCIQIDRATSLSPGRVVGVRPGVSVASTVSGGSGRFRQSSNAVMAGFSLAHPAQLSAAGPFLATDEPRDADSDTAWIDPATRERLYQRIFEHCIAKQTVMGNGGPGLDNGCMVYADSALYSRETLLQAVSLSPGLIAMPALPKTTFADVWNDYVDALRDMGTMTEQAGDTFARFMFSGCMEGGSLRACLFDIASAPIPFAKGAKMVKVAVEVVDDGADVVKAGEKAADAGTAARAAGATAPVEIAPGKLDYVFGRVTSSPKNQARSTSMELGLDRVGIRDDAAGRAIVEQNLREAAGRPDNVVERVGKNGNLIEVRESLLAGPYGFVRVRSVWIVEGGRLRLSTVVIEGGKK